MPGEKGPDIAGVDPMAEDLAVLDESLSADEQQRLHELVAQVSAGEPGLKELADIVASTLGEGDDESGATAPTVSGEACSGSGQGPSPRRSRSRQSRAASSRTAETSWAGPTPRSSTPSTWSARWFAWRRCSR